MVFCTKTHSMTKTVTSFKMRKYGTVAGFEVTKLVNFSMKGSLPIVRQNLEVFHTKNVLEIAKKIYRKLKKAPLFISINKSHSGFTTGKIWVQRFREITRK